MNTVDVRSLAPATKLRAIIYGAAGARKTTLAATFPKPLLFLDFDQKLEPIMGVEGIDVIQYSFAEVSQAKTVFDKFCKDFREAKKDPKYATIVIDSLTSLDTLCVRNFVIVAGKDPTASATLPIYGDVSGWYNFFFAELKALGHIHIVVIAHESYNVDEESAIHSIQPLITGKVIAKIPALFKEMWYMERRATTDEAVLHYKPWKKATANSLLLHAGNGEIANPTFDKIMAAVEEQKKGKK